MFSIKLKLLKSSIIALHACIAGVDQTVKYSGFDNAHDLNQY